MELLQISQKVIKTLESLSDDKKQQLDKTLQLDFRDIFDAQNMQSRLFAMGLISQDTAQYVYSRLNRYSSLSLADRLIMMFVLKQLGDLYKSKLVNKK